MVEEARQYVGHKKHSRFSYKHQKNAMNLRGNYVCSLAVVHGVPMQETIPDDIFKIFVVLNAELGFYHGAICFDIRI